MATLGEVTASTPRDRNASFSPQFIKKRETLLAEGIADCIIGLYALGTSTREINNWMEENLGTRVSADTISSITDRILPKVKAWRNRTTLYCTSNTQFYKVCEQQKSEGVSQGFKDRI